MVRFMWQMVSLLRFARCRLSVDCASRVVETANCRAERESVILNRRNREAEGREERWSAMKNPPPTEQRSGSLEKPISNSIRANQLNRDNTRSAINRQPTTREAH
jgi:hypothetical protein